MSMNIKQAEELSGVSRQNIRFYEKQGLLHPARNAENDYRTYTPADVDVLKRIRMLRMLDMPLDDVRAVLEGSRTLSDAAALQKQSLARQAEQLQAAMALCDVLQSADPDALDVDALLAGADGRTAGQGYFTGWVSDYKAFAHAHHEARFTFFPDGAVTTPREFTDALLAYGRENGLDIVITKESMYPEFTIDGVAFTAQRNYTSVQGVPVASVLCTAADPDSLLPPAGKGRRLTQWLVRFGLPALAVLALALLFLWPNLPWLVQEPGGWVLLASLAVAAAAMLVRSYYLTWNENGKRGSSHKK